MNRAARFLLRFTTLVLTLVVVVAILGVSFWYVFRAAQANSPAEGMTISAQTVEQWGRGLLLRFRTAELNRPANPSDEREVMFTIEPGESLISIAGRLKEQGLVADDDLFRDAARYWGADRGIQAGIYSLSPSMTMREIIDQLQHGQVATITVTIPEGWRAEEIAAQLEKQGVVAADAFLQAVAKGREDFAFLRERPEGSSASLEGFLFPDTYQFPVGIQVDDVIAMLLQNWGVRVPEELRQKAANKNLTLYQAVILASIVEREARVPEERPIIAGVYLNRLANGMTLDADPTVQYGLGFDQATGRWWRELTAEDLKVASPYNTYTNPGLPPGPICNPGLAAIQAALEPMPTDYLYFVHKGDGSHAFATTYEEHVQNVNRYSKR